MYVGEYKDGKPEGNGQYTWSNGSYYVGEFRGGLKHGKGKWRRSKDNNTNQYEGEYKNDKKNGYGEFTWASGNVYKGGYKDDEREGFGKMRWTDGSTYEGDWVRGIQHGKGKMSFPDGTIKEGFFENNVYKGDKPPIVKSNSPKNRGPLKSLSNVHPAQKSSIDERSPSSRKSKKKNSTNSLNNTGSFKKRLIIRNGSNSSQERKLKNRLNPDNPNTGYINGMGPKLGFSTTGIKKPTKRKSVSDTNSSFGDNGSTSPYMNPEKEYMLQCINKGGKVDVDLQKKHLKSEKNGVNHGDENFRNYNSQNQDSSKKTSKNGKLEPIFPIKNGGANGHASGQKQLTQNRSSNTLVTPQSRSHYGKFPGKVKGKIESIKSSRGGSGDRKRKNNSNARLSPLMNKPAKVVPEPK